LTNLTFLHLEYNQLSGEIPSEIGNLTNLIWLNFIHNQLSGEIPSSICNLDMNWSNPNNFNIYENQLCPPYPECIEDYVGEQDTSECEEQLLCNEGEVDLGWGDCNELWSGHTDGCMSSGCYSIEQTTELIRTYTIVGEIPSEIGELVNLRYIYIEGCDISGEIPLEIGNLVNLQSFSIYDNEEFFESSGLTGEIPDEIGNLTNLEWLELSDNQLTGGIPESLGNLTNLDGLFLSNNQLDGEIPVWIGNLINLTYLQLDGNQFMGQIPSTIGNLINLYQLDLQNNQLSGEIPIEICNQGDGIPYLNNNQLCPPYPECLSGSGIGYQDTSECEEPSLCDEETEVELWGECYSIENTTEILLPSSELTGEIPESIGDLINLNSLVLYNNQLSGEIPESIENLTNLMWLNLYNNQLTGEIPESIGNLTNLTSLDLGFNQFSGEIPESLGNLTNLNHLWLYHNQLNGEIPITICNIDQNLEHFYIYDNQLCPPYPECLTEEDIGEQDTSECEPDPQIGDECVTEDGWIGFYDCELCCWDEWIIENWLGDGWCDYLGGCGFEGPLFNCPELGYDCGDCTEDWDGTDPSGLCSDDCLIPGDVNNDSILNILDIVSMITLILDGEYDECGDVNSDGDLNILDVITFVNIILSIP
jgi:Leucine-rich repeat (LRR) protein